MSSADRGARFVVLDGIDGCGKSTQARRLVEALAQRADPPPLHLREPGSTAAGERIRALFLDPEAALGTEAQLLLVTAARRQMLDERVRPALAAGRDVVCERFHPATYAYQAHAGGLDGEEVLALLDRWAGDPVPDLVLVLSLDVGEALRRAASRAAPDRFEARGEEFLERVAAGFARYVERVPTTRSVDASGTEDEVAARILAEVERARP